MKIATTIAALQGFLDPLRRDRKQIGFVPTMGALHKGHVSLVNQSGLSDDATVVSIFVNPTQFNDPNDLIKYPRSPEKDLLMLEKSGCHYVFMPSVEEMYPEPDTRQFSFGSLGEVMEGKSRPGHFNGVAQVVDKLFEAVKPHNAYFGEKDFQQLAIIKYLNKTLNWNVNIVSCPIVRESDGLAMSSRNMLLTDEERRNAAVISQTLFEALKLAVNMPLKSLKDWVIQTINANQLLQAEYFEIVNDCTLQIYNSWEEPGGKVGCIAAKIGKVRLIDNVRFH